MSIKAVLDTNVVVSALLNPAGPPGQILEFVKQGSLTPVISAAVEIEYRKVLCRAKFGFSQTLVDGTVTYLVAKAIRAVPLPQGLDFSKDPDDEVFYNLAASAQAYLVTGNRRHFPDDGIAVTPQELLKLF